MLSPAQYAERAAFAVEFRRQYMREARHAKARRERYAMLTLLYRAREYNAQARKDLARYRSLIS